MKMNEIWNSILKTGRPVVTKSKLIIFFQEDDNEKVQK